jgi:D-tyrosyl-tRNA(Tyr) deacylase
MKVLLQRVTRAAVRVEGQTVGRIDAGLVALVGAESGDEEPDARYLADKTVDLRIFPDDEGKMNRSLDEARGAVLAVSQFTLAGSTRRGRRPSFSAAAPPDEGRHLVGCYVARLRERGISVAEGIFGAHMEVELVNDGPVTLLLDPPPGRAAR